MSKYLDDMGKKLGYRIQALSKERDRLRNMESDISSLIEDCDEAIDCLHDARRSIEDAADTLSKTF